MDALMLIFEMAGAAGFAFLVGIITFCICLGSD
jgi:hypothetical protein